ncbi:ParA family protein [Labrys wisconsinensis]|uniref:Cellulose biosynthesis protein BcsQ n=1 Tax=Labrys wisconsinensis TaxID=425677 RepID=A0ABU0J2J5_9HYPH|nr:ParA family protein [Labrys wisconsinensis]MDQ0468471.1 cellulose biosynthesis protein BcsQ [Labrys wisconsinensis]
MKSVAFFNNKGGVGKTSLIYHLSWMYADLGRRVLMADLDPQSNLTAMCFKDDVIERIYESGKPDTIYTAVEPVKRGVGDLRFFDPLEVTERLAIVPGDLLLSDFEDELSATWPRCVDRDERAFRVTSAFHRIIKDAGQRYKADLALIDVGPTFGALNRAALIAADFVVIPVAPDLFSVRGLENVGGRLKLWRAEWQDRLSRAPKLDFTLPPGGMQPIGYVVSRHTEFADGVVRAFQKWITKIPAAYRGAVENPAIPDEALSLGRLKDYRSLIAMAQEARKPMFKLRPGDGAIGGHQGAVSAAYDDFEKLARRITTRIGLPV